MSLLNNQIKILLTVLVIGLFISYSPIFATSHSISLTETIVQPVIVIGGTQGSQIEQFNEPDGVAVSSDGTIYAGDTYNLRIQIFDKNGTYIGNITEFADVPNNEVQGIAINSLGEICAIDMFGYKVRIFDPNGTQIHEFGSRGTNAGEFQEPQGLAIDSNDRIFIVDTQRNNVMLFYRNGTFITEFGSSSLGAPESILIDEDNSRILICSEASGKIVVFDYETFAKITEFGNAGLGTINDDPEGIVLDSDGYIILNDEGAGKISVFFSNLTYFQSFGGKGSAKGYFNSPDGIAFDHNNKRLIVADQGNYRIQVFNWTEVMQVLNSLPPVTESTTQSSENTTSQPTVGFSVTPTLVASIILFFVIRKLGKNHI